MGFNYIVLKGKSEYKAELSTSPVGSMIKLENLFNGLEENVEFLEKKIEQYENDLNASKLEYDKPFAHEDEYKAKLARQCELNAQLDLENKNMVDADLGSKEEEVTEEKNYNSNEKDYNACNNSYTSEDIKTSEDMKIAEDVAESMLDYKIEGSRGR